MADGVLVTTCDHMKKFAGDFTLDVERANAQGSEVSGAHGVGTPYDERSDMPLTNRVEVRKGRGVSGKDSSSEVSWR